MLWNVLVYQTWCLEKLEPREKDIQPSVNSEINVLYMMSRASGDVLSHNWFLLVTHQERTGWRVTPLAPNGVLKSNNSSTPLSFFGVSLLENESNVLDCFSPSNKQRDKVHCTLRWALMWRSRWLKIKAPLFLCLGKNAKGRGFCFEIWDTNEFQLETKNDESR